MNIECTLLLKLHACWSSRLNTCTTAVQLALFMYIALKVADLCTMLHDTVKLAGTFDDCKQQSFSFICLHTFCTNHIIIQVLLIDSYLQIIGIIGINPYSPREVTIHITVVQSTERGNNSFESTQAVLGLQSDVYSQLLLVSSVRVIEIARYGWYTT